MDRMGEHSPSQFFVPLPEFALRLAVIVKHDVKSVGQSTVLLIGRALSMRTQCGHIYFSPMPKAL